MSPTPTPAPACKAGLAQATNLWPGRSRLSDGIMASTAHTKANPTSDHELGNAFDLTHDPAHGVDCNVLAEQVISDPRTKYVIWNRRIYNKAISPRWRAYSGSNPHTKHMHVSIHGMSRNDTSPWWKRAVTTTTPAKIIPPPPATTATVYPGEDTMVRHDMHIRLDGNGKGWARLEVPAPTVVSLIANGPFPPVDGYGDQPVLTRQDRDGATVVVATEGPPGVELLVAVWTL